jgi:hypothetical protein
MLVKLEVPPGVYRNATSYSNQGRYYDTNLVRWVDGMLSPLGGWQKFSLTPVVGKCRGLFAWRDNDDYRWLAIGTNSKLYVNDEGSLFDITPVGFNPGGDSSAVGLGFGSLLFGAQAYGTPRSGVTSIVTDAATWSFDAWGQNLVGCSTGDGKIYEWTLIPADRAAVVANAPVDNRFVLVSEQRHLVALGAGGDPRKVQWSDSENNTVWNPTSTNQAGDFLLNTPGHIRCGVKTRGETVILTSADAHAMRYIGYPLVFSFERVGTNCGISGPNAAVAIESGVLWFGNDARIYSYSNGVVTNIPCDVEDWLEENFDKLKQTQVYAGTLTEHSEVYWFFPAIDGTTKYCVYNYRAGIWYIGSLDRISWLDRGVWKHPVGVSSDGYLYQHEDGNTDSGVSRVGTIYAETGAMEIAPGERVMDILQLIPDEAVRGAVNVTLKCKYTPTGTETSYGPYTVRDDGYTDTRASGRQAKLRIEAARDEDFRVGNFRADVVQAGGR